MAQGLLHTDLGVTRTLRVCLPFPRASWSEICTGMFKDDIKIGLGAAGMICGVSVK